MTSCNYIYIILLYNCFQNWFGGDNVKVSKVLRIDEDVYNQFKDLTILEGRLMGKMLEIMMLEYIKITKAVDEQIDKKSG